MDAAEEASGVACRALGEVEDRIAALPARSLAGLRLKTLVAQGCDEIELDWPDKLGAGLMRDLLALTAEPDVDWHAPPSGFMASPAIDPMCFLRIPQGLQMELQRLRTIAWAEFRRRTVHLHEVMGEDEAEGRRAAIRAELYLLALTAAVDFGSVEAATLAALGRPVGPDPSLALIEQHRTAYAEWDRLSQVWSDNQPTFRSRAYRTGRFPPGLPHTRDQNTMGDVLTFTPRPKQTGPDALPPLAGADLRASLEEAAQTA